MRGYIKRADGRIEINPSTMATRVADSLFDGSKHHPDSIIYTHSKESVDKEAYQILSCLAVIMTEDLDD